MDVNNLFPWAETNYLQGPVMVDFLIKLTGRVIVQ